MQLRNLLYVDSNIIYKSYKVRIISYILLTMIEIGVIILFYVSSKVIFHPDILVNYPEKNHHRIQFLVLFIFHVIDLSVLCRSNGS